MFNPLIEGEIFQIERLCKCRCEEHRNRRKKCKDWIPIMNRTSAQRKAFETMIRYFAQWEPKIWKIGQIELEYAFYRIVRIG